MDTYCEDSKEREEQAKDLERICHVLEGSWQEVCAFSRWNSRLDQERREKNEKKNYR